MKKISVKGSTSYDVLIENNYADDFGKISHEVIGGQKVFIVTDSNVASLYLTSVYFSFKNAGYEVFDAIVPPGEASKSLSNYEYILSQLIDAKLDRSDIIVALGGGVIGDLAGFVASTFKRGIKLIQIPTTLLACVDSSVGGKTAINFDDVKNQIGSFYNPSLVLCDPSLLASLNKEILLDGYAEIIKYSILNGEDILDSLRKANLSGDYSLVIQKSIITKRNIVEADEKDTSVRQYLNLGHLIGHAIEAFESYDISHGHAVAYGLFLESKACALYGLSSFSMHNRIKDVLDEFGFKLEKTYQVSSLMPFIKNDKRLNGRQLQVIVPKGFGDCHMSAISLDDLEKFISLAL